MKLRFGHVSNSSTSSFVMYKPGLTEEQLEGMREVIEKHNAQTDDAYVDEIKYFFIGDVSNHCSEVMNMIQNLEISHEVWAHSY